MTWSFSRVNGHTHAEDYNARQLVQSDESLQNTDYPANMLLVSDPRPKGQERE